MKKYISVFLAAGMIIGSFNTAFAEAPETTTGEVPLELFITGDFPEEKYVLEEDEIPALGSGSEVYDLVNDTLDKTSDEIKKGSLFSTGSAITIDVSKLSITADTESIKELSQVVSSAINDRTDIFYLDNSFSYETQGEDLSSISLEISDEWLNEEGTPDVAALSANVSSAEEGMALMMNEITDDMSDLEKAFSVHERMVEEVDYDMYNYSKGSIPSTDYTANGLFTTRHAVCQGYAEAYKAIMTKLGIECKLVSSQEINHAWNLIKIDGSWYHVDVTWDDPYMRSTVNYNDCHHWKYFLCSDSEFLKHGTAWQGKYPAASTSTADKGYIFRTYQTEYGSACMSYKDGYWNAVIYDFYTNDKYVLKVKMDGSEATKTTIDTRVGGLRSSQDTARIVGDKVYFLETAGSDSATDKILFDINCYSRLDGSFMEKVVEHTANTNIIGLSVKNNVLNYTLEDNSKSTPSYSRVPLEAVPETPSVKFAKSSVTLYDKEPYDLGVEIKPANLEVSFTSSDETVATVDGSGIVTPIANGKTVITATGEAVSATCDVTVAIPEKTETETEPDIDPEKPIELSVTDGEYKTLGQIALPASISDKYEWAYPATKLSLYVGTTSEFEYILKPAYREADKNYDKHYARVTVNYATGKSVKPSKGKVSNTRAVYKPTLVAINKTIDITVDGKGTYKSSIYLREKMGHSISSVKFSVSTKIEDLNGTYTFDGENDRLDMAFTNPSVGKATFTITGEVDGVETKAVKVNVNFKAPATKKALKAGKPIVITTKTAGTVDLLDRKGSPVICTVTNPAASKVINVELAGSDAARFEITKIFRNNAGEITSYAVTAKDCDLRNKTSYSIVPVYTLDDAEKTALSGKAFVIKTAQSSVKVGVYASGNILYGTSGRITLVAIGEGTSTVYGEATILEAPDFKISTEQDGRAFDFKIRQTAGQQLAPGQYTVKGYAAFEKSGKNVGVTEFTYKITVTE